MFMSEHLHWLPLISISHMEKLIIEQRFMRPESACDLPHQQPHRSRGEIIICTHLHGTSFMDLLKACSLHGLQSEIWADFFVKQFAVRKIS